MLLKFIRAFVAAVVTVIISLFFSDSTQTAGLAGAFAALFAWDGFGYFGKWFKSKSELEADTAKRDKLFLEKKEYLEREEIRKQKAKNDWNNV